jgi:osmotically inducible protein OsmC
MALTLVLSEARLEAIELETEAFVTLALGADNIQIAQVKLKVRGAIPGIDPEQLLELASLARQTCPISKALKAPILVEAVLDD